MLSPAVVPEGLLYARKGLAKGQSATVAPDRRLAADEAPHCFAGPSLHVEGISLAQGKGVSVGRVMVEGREVSNERRALCVCGDMVHDRAGRVDGRPHARRAGASIWT